MDACLLKEIMEPRLYVLKLVYDALGLEVSVATIGSKVQLQKAIYLAQRMNVDLGYRFAWFERGPYSNELAEDYHKLESTLNLEPPSQLPIDVSLKHDATVSLGNLRVALEGAPVGLDSPEWMELLASLDFLRVVSRCPEAEVEEVIRREKGKLLSFKAKADEALDSIGLMAVPA